MTVRTTLRWRLTIVYGAAACAVGLALLILSVYLAARPEGGLTITVDLPRSG